MAEGTEPGPQPEVEDDLFAGPDMQEALRSAQAAIRDVASEAAERVKEARLAAEADPSPDDGRGAAGVDSEIVGSDERMGGGMHFADVSIEDVMRDFQFDDDGQEQSVRAKVKRLQSANKALAQLLQEVKTYSSGWHKAKEIVASLPGKDLIYHKNRQSLAQVFGAAWNDQKFEKIDPDELMRQYHGIIVAVEGVLDQLRTSASGDQRADARVKRAPLTLEELEEKIPTILEEISREAAEWQTIIAAVPREKKGEFFEAARQELNLGLVPMVRRVADEIVKLNPKHEWKGEDARKDMMRAMRFHETLLRLTATAKKVAERLEAQVATDGAEDRSVGREEPVAGDGAGGPLASKAEDAVLTTSDPDSRAGDTASLDSVSTVVGRVSDTEVDKPLSREERRLGELQSLANQFQDLYNEFMVEEDLRTRNRSRTREHGGAILFGDGVALGSSGREMYVYAGDDHKTAGGLRPVPREPLAQDDDRSRLVGMIHELHGSFAILNNREKFEELATAEGAQGRRGFELFRDKLKDLVGRLEAQIRAVERVEGDETPINTAVVEFEPMDEESARTWWEGQTWAGRCGRLRGDLIRFDIMVEQFRTAGKMDDLVQAMHRLTREDQVFAEEGGSLRLDEVLRGVEEQLRAGKNNPEIAGPAANELLRGFIAYETILRAVERARQRLLRRGTLSRSMTTPTRGERQTRDVASGATVTALRAAAAPVNPTPAPEVKGELQLDDFESLGNAEQKKRIRELFAALGVWRQSFVSKMEAALSGSMPDAAQRTAVIHEQFPGALGRALRGSELRMVIDEKLRARMSDERREEVIGLLVKLAGKI